MRKEEKLLKKAHIRVKAEKAIESFFAQIVLNNDSQGAIEWSGSTKFNLYLEKMTIECHRLEDYFVVEGLKFKYDFSTINNVCNSFSLDTIGV